MTYYDLIEAEIARNAPLFRREADRTPTQIVHTFAKLSRIIDKELRDVGPLWSPFIDTFFSKVDELREMGWGSE
jgi:hypothetical protein